MDTVKLNKYKISYYYLATGMEGRPDEYPEMVIESTSEELAIYSYLLIWFDSYHRINFKNYLKKERYERYWGIMIKKID